MRAFLRLAAFTSLLAWVFSAQAQWQMQDAHGTADLRGIDSVGNGVAWASGSNGTVLRTEDAGFVWQLCAVPPGAEKLDFRGVQAVDNNTAIVMSSGKGDLSRLYKTTDGCQTWKLVFTNPDKGGFWDALHRMTDKQWLVLGDPVNGQFTIFISSDAGDTWEGVVSSGLVVGKGAGAFAASNSSLTNVGPLLVFGSGGAQALAYETRFQCKTSDAVCRLTWHAESTPLAHGPSEAGIFSIGGRPIAAKRSASLVPRWVAVGGNYAKPKDASACAAFAGNDGWTNATSQPRGYRSAVAYEARSKAWIAVGPNGTDVSSDDGRNWRPLRPGPGDAPDADQHWNALSLPFVVGPGGRIGVLRPDALSAGKVLK